MNSHPTKAVLLAYLHVELSPSERKLVSTHLAQCSQCQTEIDKMSVLEDHIQRSLVAQTATATPDVGVWDSLRVNLPIKRQEGIFKIRGKPMKKALTYSFITLLVVFGMLMAVPSVRAAVIEAIANYFRFDLPNDQGSLTWGMEEDWPFRPYGVDYFPEGFNSRGSVSGITEAYPDIFILSFTFASEDRFIKIINSKGTGLSDLPEGESLTILSQPAVLIRDPELKEILGGDVDSVSDYISHEAYSLTWFMEDVRIELITNFSFEEMIKIADSLIHLEESSGE